MTGQHCPDCGTPTTPEATPGCGCAAQRAVRAAQAQAAYVQQAHAAEAPTQLLPPVPATPPTPPAPSTLPALPALSAPPAPPAPPALKAPPMPQAPPDPSAELSDEEGTNPLRPRPYIPLPTEGDTPRGGFPPSGPLPPLTPAMLFAQPPGAPLHPEPPSPHRGALKAVALCGLAVAIGVAALAGGAFSESDGRAQASPRETSTWLPGAGRDIPHTRVSEMPPPYVGPAAPGGEEPQQLPAEVAAPAVPKTSTSPTPKSGPKPPSPPKPKPEPKPTRTPAADGKTLRLGDSGPEVVELQQRLAQLWLFNGAPNGKYDERLAEAVRLYQGYRRIGSADKAGVYGPATRRALEAETREPGEPGQFPGPPPGGPGQFPTYGPGPGPGYGAGAPGYGYAF
ncbi:peptidoglycan-binding protein [Streptomyces sp. NPDC087658]|uniref:peptidoglycan-binding domain-containing protein n=1 Tax=Streptomyces sp. NPDC087658 TaxID=3365800 RepID=UPI0037FB4A6B